MKDDREIRLEVLLHMSEQVHDTTAKTIAAANALFGAILPVAVGFLLFTAGEKDRGFLSLDVLAASLGAAVCLATIFNAGLWVEISRCYRYKYTSLYPELYRLAGLSGESFGQFVARQGRFPMAAVLFHLTVLVFAGVIVFGGISKSASGEPRVILLALCGWFALAIAASYVWAIPQIVRNINVIIESPTASPPAQPPPS